MTGISILFLCVLMVLTLADSGTGRSLFIVPSLSEYRVDSGSTVNLQCILNGHSTHGGSFNWIGPAMDSGRASITLDVSGTVSSLTINSVGQSDMGRYNCSYTNIDAVFIVLNMISEPHFLNISEYQEFIEGTDAVIECPAFFGDPPANMIWTRGNVVLNDSRFTLEDGQMRIQNIRETDEATYRCSLRHLQVAIIDYRLITVTVLERSDLVPKIVEPVSPINIIYGDPLNLTCQLQEPRDNVHYTWTVDTDYEDSQVKNTTPSLHRDADGFLGGRYTCEAENEYGYDEQVFYVRILAPPEPRTCFNSEGIRIAGETVVLEHCQITSPVQLSDLDYQWSKRNWNGEWVEIRPGGRFRVNHNGILTIMNIRSSDSGLYQVNISNSQGSALHTEQLQVILYQDNPAPLPTICEVPMKSVAEGATVVLGYCELISPVRPSELQFQWTMMQDSGKVMDIRSGGRFEVNFDGLLTINDTRPSDSGLYQVNISNSLGSALHSVQLQVNQSNESELLIGSIIGGLLGGLVILIIAAAIVAALMLRYKYIEKLRPTYTAINQDSPVLSLKELGGDNIFHQTAITFQSSHWISIPDHLIISATDIKLENSIGQGEFGIVYKGYIVTNSGQTIVAVKTIKGFYNHSSIEEMLKECTKMKELNHPNILKLIGVCLDGGPAPYIIVPFMENGSLLSYLKKNRNTLLLTQNEVKPVLKQLVDMSLQVAKGMEYLASMKIVHRDLAARNCMMDMNSVIKVADFGLAETLGNKDYFRQDKTVNIKFPMRWLAPESLEDHIFSEKSDVWAYGVTCWEIFSGGKVPYPGVNVSELLWLLKNGQHLDKPENTACSDHMYSFMLQCWALEPKNRPSFTEIVRSLSVSLEAMADYLPLCEEIKSEV